MFEGRARSIRRMKAGLFASTGMLCGVCAPAAAQSQDTPVIQYTDENGVDLITGLIAIDDEYLSIGDGTGRLVYRVNLKLDPDVPGNHFLSHDNYGGFAWHGKDSDNLDIAAVSFEGKTEYYQGAGPIFSALNPQGSQLSLSGNDYIYKRRDGIEVLFSQFFFSYSIPSCPGDCSNGIRLPSRVTLPDGTIININYKSWQAGGETLARIQSVTNNHGYQLKFSYGSSTSRIVTAVTAINSAVDYCSPTADSCTGLTQTWPAVTIAESNPGIGNTPNTYTITDPTGAATVYRFDIASTTPYTRVGLKGIKRPGSSVENITYSYTGASSAPTSITANGVTYSYAVNVINGELGLTRTGPNGMLRTVYGNVACPKAFEDELGRRTSFLCDSVGRPTRITSPEGNYTEYTYDIRGNVTQRKRVAKAGSGLANIITSATYPSTCTNPLLCYQPTTTTDEFGKVTDYTYDSATGQLLTVTLPAAVTGGVIRPQTRYGYTPYQAYYKSGAGSIVASGQPVSLLTSVSSCRTLATCSGSADEVKTTNNYGPQTTGAPNNLLPVSTTSGSGDGVLTATESYGYDSIGNRITTDGPLAGSADTVRLRYDARRQIVGVIGADPDGVGAGKHAATRITYNPSVQVIAVEKGVVNSQSDSDWASFTALEAVQTSYNASGRKDAVKLIGGGVTQALTQFSYDIVGRPECTAVRMNPSIFNSPPSSACTLGTAGTMGPDRITKTSYDNAGQVTKMQTAYGTADQSDEVTSSYTNNGKLASVTDGEGNKTTYEYDGHDRLSKTRYPSPTTDGVSSTTDYEQLGYDAASNVTNRRLRDGQTIAFTYDNLSRVTLKNLPGSEPDVTYGYDLLGHMTSLVRTDLTHMLSYDALGRLTSEAEPFGTVSYQYDLAGRRTRMTWPDSFYVTYDYNVTGEMTAIRENGATSGVGVLATYGYDNLGRRTSVTRGNGTVASYSYDGVSRLVSLSENLAGTTYDFTHGFAYNPASQITSLTRSNDAYAWTGHYNVDRNYSVNGLNQITAAGATSLGYDGRGNLTTSGSSSYTYSSENILKTAPGATLYYDALARLVEYDTSISTRLVYDGGHMAAEISNPTASIMRRYVFGPGADEPIIWYEGSGTSDRRWLHADERGSVVAVTNSSGTVIGTNSYDEYGIPGSGNIGRLQYTGQAWLPEIGMSYYKARIYSPTLGRFMQTDPIGYGDGMNWYNYVRSDPVNKADPSGLGEEPEDPPIVVTGVKFTCTAGAAYGTCLPPEEMPGGANYLPQDSEKGESRGLREYKDRDKNSRRVSTPVCPSPSAVNISGSLAVLGGGPGAAGFTGTLTDVQSGAEYSFHARGQIGDVGGGGAVALGIYSVSGTLRGGFDALSHPFSVGFWEVGVSWVSTGGASITNGHGSLGSISIDGTLAAPAGAALVSFEGVDLKLVKPGKCGAK